MSNEAAMPDLATATPIPGLLGNSDAMQTMLRQLRKVAPTDVTVLIVGESGSGKGAVAQALHALSRRASRPFIALNCGAIAPGLTEDEALRRARGGTLLLDEITEMPAEVQAKLLRVLERRSDLRVLATTHCDVGAAIREGRFRPDLLYRLAVFPLHVPALRNRTGDVELLAQHFLDGLNRREGAAKTFSRGCLQQLTAHPWPENVRELRSVVSRAFLLADQAIDKPFGDRPRSHVLPRRREGVVEVVVGTPLAHAQRELIEATLDHFGGDKRRAASTLGVSLKTLYNRLDAYRAHASGGGA